MRNVQKRVLEDTPEFTILHRHQLICACELRCSQESEAGFELSSVTGSVIGRTLEGDCKVLE